MNENPKINHVPTSDILAAIGFYLEDSAPDLSWREKFDSGYAAAFCLLEALKKPCDGDVPCEKGGWYLSFDDGEGQNYICLYDHLGESAKVWDEVLGHEARRDLLDSPNCIGRFSICPPASSLTKVFRRDNKRRTT